MSARPILSGDLEFIPLSELFQILGGNRCTGVLRITSEFSKTPGEIYFRSGEPIDANWGFQTGLKAAYALFGWRDGRFEFQSREFLNKQRIRKRAMEIVLDAIRMVDDGLLETFGTSRRSPDSRDALRQGKGELPTVNGSLIDYDYILSEERYTSGKQITSEGSHGNWMWAILEGRVLLSRESGGIKVPLIHLGEGAFIGTFESLLFGEHVRPATITATRNVHTALLDTRRLSGEFTSLSPGFRTHLLKMSKQLREVSDDLAHQLLKRGQSHWTKLSTSPSFKAIGCLLDSIPFMNESIGKAEHERLQREYETLSSTFKSFIQYTARCVLLMTGMAASIREERSDSLGIVTRAAMGGQGRFRI